MMHVATVHWGGTRWVEPQLRHFDRYIGQPFRVYSFLDELPPEHANRFFYTSGENLGDHATWLNMLAEIIRFNADPSDPIMFIDGDAFPVAPIAPLLDARLARHGLIAVQRYENNGDVQPHPCFCVTTVGLWRQIGGDWHPGHTWVDPQGKAVTDIGGNLLRAVDSADVDWYPLRRMNKVDLHPVFFAVYGDDEHGGVVYHHGAAFRPGGLTRADFVRDEFRDVRSKPVARLMTQLPRRGLAGKARVRYDPVRKWKLQQVHEATENGRRLSDAIDRDEDFWRALV